MSATLDLYRLLPALYKLKDAQLAQSMNLLTPAERLQLANLQSLATLTADQQTQLDQLQAKASRGPLQSLLGMIPGVGKAVKDIDISDDAFKGIEAIIGSMTPFERSNPDVIDLSRRKRLAGGSGKDITEVNAFLKQFEQMKQMMKMMNKMPGAAFRPKARN